MGTLENLLNGLEIWNEKLQEIWAILLQSPEAFKGGGIWRVVLGINGALQAIGYALLVLFFLVGVIKTCGSFAEMKRPEAAVKLFVRFALAKAVITYGLELMMALFSIIQGVITAAMGASGIGAQATLSVPTEVAQAIEDLGFFQSIGPWVLSLIACLIIIVMSFVMIMSVYGRFFRLYIYTAIAPVPLSAFVGEPSQNIGKSFLKSYAAVCMEGAVIVIACVIFSAFTGSQPAVAADAEPVTIVLQYCAEVIFNMLILVGAVKMADRVVREMMGL